MIMAAVMMLAFIPTVLIGFEFYRCAQSSMETDKLDALTGMVRMIDIHLTRNINRLISDVQIKAENDSLKRVTENVQEPSGFESSDQSEVKAFLLQTTGFPVIGGALINTDGKVIISSQPDEVSIMLDKTELYRTIMSGKPFYIGLIAINDISNMLEVAVPILDDSHEITGILKQNISLDALWDYLNSINLGESGYTFLIRKNGYVIFNKDRANMPLLYHEYQNNNSLEQLVADFKAGRLENERGTIAFESKGVEYIGAYERVGYVDCIAVVADTRNNLSEYMAQFKAIMIVAVLLIFALVVICGHIISRLYAAPLKLMNDTLGKISSGDLTARSSFQKQNELGELSRNINRLADGYQKNEKELRMSSRIDSLTHLPNRNAIYEVLDTLLYKHPNQAILLLGLRGFKELNESLGYDIGDKILMEVGDILRGLPQHVCYPSRLGGVEFLVFLTNWTAPRYPEKIAEKIINSIEGIRFINEIHVDIGACIGIEYIGNEKTDKKKLIKNSGAALHKAGSIGGNAYFVHYSYQQKEL